MLENDFKYYNRIQHANIYSHMPNLKHPKIKIILYLYDLRI